MMLSWSGIGAVKRVLISFAVFLNECRIEMKRSVIFEDFPGKTRVPNKIGGDYAHLIPS